MNRFLKRMSSVTVMTKEKNNNKSMMELYCNISIEIPQYFFDL